MFAVDDPRAFPYKATVHYYSRGAMGIGLQNDDAMVDLGVIR